MRYLGADRLHFAACALLSGLEDGHVPALRSSLCEQARALCVEAKSGARRAAAAQEMEPLPVLETRETAPRRGVRVELLEKIGHIYIYVYLDGMYDDIYICGMMC